MQPEPVLDDFIRYPQFRVYALCAAILVAKMIFSAVYTAVQRSRHRGYVNPEDAAAFGGAGSRASETEHPAVAHALRIQRNDLENIPAFLAIALVYTLLGNSHLGVVAYCWTFTLARLAHTVAYTWNLQPWRAIFWGIGILALLGMIVQIVIDAI